MKQSSIPWLLVTAGLMFVASVALLGFWGWRYFNNQPVGIENSSVSDTLQTGVIRDSLQRNYTDAVRRINDSTSLPVDSVQLRELYRLRDEIPGLLNRAATAADLDTARLRIARLQGKLDELQSRTRRVEDENKRLLAELARLRNGTRNIQGPRPSIATSNPPSDNATSAIAITDARLWAVNEGGRITTEASDTRELRGSFAVRSSGAQLSLDIFVVILQPDGRVLRTDDWESGAFSTPSGSRLYSTRVRYSEGGERRLDFRLTAGDLQAGTYALQLWSGGSLLARGGAALR